MLFFSFCLLITIVDVAVVLLIGLPPFSYIN
nr:MAG TPA: hypothetical protein [Caudoviricetes sp.]